MLAAPVAAVFFLEVPWTTTSGIRNGDFGLLPGVVDRRLVSAPPSVSVGFCTANRALLEVWRRSWLLYLAAAVLLSLVLRRNDVGGDARSGIAIEDAGASLLRAFAYPLATWAWCLALIGTATRFLSDERAIGAIPLGLVVWIYLAHLPLVVALQVLVSPWSLPWQVKYPLIVVVALAILLPSYQLLVRNTFLGAWLNGRRYPRTMGAGVQRSRHR